MLLRSPRTTTSRLGVGLGLAFVLSWGCAQKDVRVGEDNDAATSSGTFTPPNAEAGADGAEAAAPQLLMCVGTECPSPFATCPSGEGPAYKCGTDLSHDPDNCGSCGNKCLVYEPIHLTSRCVDGACELECMNDPYTPTDRRNCNGEVDDGCEVDALTDPNNCGACGHACAAGEPCLKGKCGCTPPMISCNGVCVNPKTDDMNCGGCGNECEAPTDACKPMPERAYYGCMGGTCGHLKCGGASADCNNDLSTLKCAADGCEVEDIRTDRNNCGGCGIKCAPNEECVEEGIGPECAVPCSKFGKVLCPQTFACADLLNDPDNCGGCSEFCPAAGAHQVRSCVKGRCAYECAPGYADCNGNTTDGCETNLLANPGNCGACDHACDIAAGQPCVEGKCLMKACDGEVTK